MGRKKSSLRSFSASERLLFVVSGSTGSSSTLDKDDNFGGVQELQVQDQH